MSKGTVKQYQKGREKEEEAVAFYISRGWTLEQSVGIVGNLIHESNLDTEILGTADDKGSRAIAQWHGDRLKLLKSKYGNKWTDYRNQLEFVDWELKNTEKKAGDALKNSKGVWEAGRVVSDLYERPKVKYNSDDRRQRNVADVAMRVKGIDIKDMLSRHSPTYENSVAPYINGNYATTDVKKDIITPNISNFDYTSESGTFTTPNVEEDEDEKVATKDVEELQQKANEKSFIEDFYQPRQEVAEQEEQTIQAPQLDVMGIYNQVSNLVDTPIAQEGGNVDEDKKWLQNWYTNRKMTNVHLQKNLDQDRETIKKRLENIPNPTIVDSIPTPMGDVDGVYRGNTKTIELAKNAPNYVYTHEANHYINDFEGATTYMNEDVSMENFAPKDYVAPYISDQYDYYSDPKEVHSRIQVLRKEAGIRPDQEVTPDYLRNFLRTYKEDNSNINDLLFSTDEPHLIDLLNSMSSIYTKDKNRIAQEGGMLAKMKKDFGNKPKKMYLDEGSQKYKNYKEQDAYYNPELKKVSTGNWQQDLLYNNQWLIDTPVVGNYIKEQAKKVVRSSQGTGTIENETLNKIKEGTAVTDPTYRYTGGTTVNGVSLADQYFSKEAVLPTAKYKPTSDYMPFLNTYSIKDDFETNKEKQKFFNEDLMRMVFDSKDEKYNEFIKNKKPIYRSIDEGGELARMLRTDLGGHKTGVAWDEDVNLPYVSIADAWDFEPNAYAKKYGKNTGGESKEELKRLGDMAYVQSSLLHKAGNPFKVYDRFYFNPETKTYMTESDVDARRVKKQEGGKIPISSRGMYDFPNTTVQVPTNGSITMKNIPHNILGISMETGEKKLMKPDLDYFFKNTKNVLEIPKK